MSKNIMKKLLSLLSEQEQLNLFIRVISPSADIVEHESIPEPIPEPEVVMETTTQVQTKKELFDQAVELDKFYTKPHIAKKCYDAMKNLLLDMGVNLSRSIFIEPSAGGGVFLDTVEEEIIGFDILPTDPLNRIHINNFITSDFRAFLSSEQKAKDLLIIGNPPFGYQSALSIDFIKKAFDSDVGIVGFVIPVQWRKWSVQNKIPAGSKLLLDMDLPLDSFEILNKDKKVNCCFQVWTSPAYQTDMKDFRLKNSPASKHRDFQMINLRPDQTYESNIAEKEWDFAVRTKYRDFNEIIRDKSGIREKFSYLFFKASSKKVLKNLIKIDFKGIADRNSVSVLGFSQHEVVSEYVSLYEIAAEPVSAVSDVIISAEAVEEFVSEPLNVDIDFETLSHLTPLERVNRFISYSNNFHGPVFIHQPSSSVLNGDCMNVFGITDDFVSIVNDGFMSHSSINRAYARTATNVA